MFPVWYEFNLAVSTSAVNRCFHQNGDYRRCRTRPALRCHFHLGVIKLGIVSVPILAKVDVGTVTRYRTAVLSEVLLKEAVEELPSAHHTSTCIGVYRPKVRFEATISRNEILDSTRAAPCSHLSACMFEPGIARPYRNPEANLFSTFFPLGVLGVETRAV